MLDAVSNLNDLALIAEALGNYDEALVHFSSALHHFCVGLNQGTSVNDSIESSTTLCTSFPNQDGINQHKQLISKLYSSEQIPSLERNVNLRQISSCPLLDADCKQELVAIALIYNMALCSYRHQDFHKAEALLRSAKDLCMDEENPKFIKPELRHSPDALELVIVIFNLLGKLYVIKSKKEDEKGRMHLLIEGIDLIVESCRFGGTLIAFNGHTVSLCLSSLGHVLAEEGFIQEAAAAFEEAYKALFHSQVSDYDSKWVCAPVA